MNTTERLHVVRREAEVFAAQRQVDQPGEYLSEAYLASEHALRTWNPALSSLKSWIKICARNRMLEVLRQSRKRRPLTGADINLDDKADRPRFRREEFVRDLSDDARCVVLLALDPPQEVEEKVQQTDRWKRAWAKRRALIEFLREAGWCVYRIAESFREIADALGTDK